VKYILLTNLAATRFIVGVVWFVQVVHYSLLARVDREGFALHCGVHSRLTSYVVRPPMLIEFSNYYATVQGSAREQACR
jgi:delta 1-pyrroline-5-carboxylate dehydrogenase